MLKSLHSVSDSYPAELEYNKSCRDLQELVLGAASGILESELVGVILVLILPQGFLRAAVLTHVTLQHNAQLADVATERKLPCLLA